MPAVASAAQLASSPTGTAVESPPFDLTKEYCETSRWLNQLVALDDRISVHQGDVTDLPFNAATFDVVISQHVQMNVADKRGLYGEAPSGSNTRRASPYAAFVGLTFICTC